MKVLEKKARRMKKGFQSICLVISELDIETNQNTADVLPIMLTHILLQDRKKTALSRLKFWVTKNNLKLKTNFISTLWTPL